MRKIYFLLLCLFASIGLYSQQITDLQEIEVLASEDFEDAVPWVNFDQMGYEALTLNNAFGGTQSYNWSDAWGGACIHAGKSAVSGENCVQLHWGGTVTLQGFEIDPSEIYSLEVAVHPDGSIDGANWNNWGSIHLFVFDQSNVWQEQGVRIRITNNNDAGNNPFRLAFDTWGGNSGTYRNRDIINFFDEASKYTLNDAKDASAINFWVPVKLIFTGAGTSEDPFILDFYLNGEFVGTESFDDLVWKGDSMIGLQKTGEGDDTARFDNFKLSLMGKTTGIKPVASEKISVWQSGKESLTIKSGIYGSNTEYKLFNIIGGLLMQNVLTDAETVVPAGHLPAGVYILQVTDNQTGASQSIRTIVK